MSNGLDGVQPNEIVTVLDDLLQRRQIVAIPHLAERIDRAGANPGRAMPRELPEDLRGPSRGEGEERPAVLGDRPGTLVLEERENSSEERGIDPELQSFDGARADVAVGVIQIAQDQPHSRLGEEHRAKNLVRVSSRALDPVHDGVGEELDARPVGEPSDRFESDQVVIGLLGFQGKHGQERRSRAGRSDEAERPDDVAPGFDVRRP